MSRPSKLTPEVENTIIAAVQQVGVTYEEAARYAGIGARTFYDWQARARDLVDAVPANWRSMKIDELRDLAEDLDATPRRGSGAGGRVLKEDLVSAIDRAAGRYVDFFRRLEKANLDGEMSTAAALRQIGNGGTRLADGTFEPLTSEQEIYEPEVDDKGKRTGKWVPVRRVVRRQLPDASVLKFILERRYRRWSPRRAVDPLATPDDPTATARQIVDALEEMDASIPAPTGS